MKNIKSFTLLEILVVVTIISLLGTVSMNSYSTTSKNARDIKRKADLENVKLAIVMYQKIEKEYPPANAAGWIDPLIVEDPSGDRNKDKRYLINVPSDPMSGYTYKYIEATPFELCARLEDSDNPIFITKNCGTYNCNYCTTTTGEIMQP